MTVALDKLADQVLEELRPGLSADVLEQIAPLSEALSAAGRIMCYGVGREGIMMRALAMRLFHLGCDAHVVGDMTTPPVRRGDVLFVSAGPGYFSTVAALADIARSSGGKALSQSAPVGATAWGTDSI